MRRALAVFLAASCLGAGAQLLACGDKFLVVSRNTRFRKANAPRTPAVILIYAEPKSNLPMALANVPVDATLRKAGYQPTSVTTPEDLERALTNGRWDLIVADGADCESLREKLPEKDGPVVLPVLFHATSAELKRAKTLYSCVLDSPTKSQAFLETIDDALALRTLPAAPPARTTG